MESRAINFGAATKGLLNFNGTGIGIAEISHRSKEFTTYLQCVEQNIRKLLDFSAVVLNMLARHRLLHPQLKDEDRVLDYVEASRMGGSTVHIAADSRKYSQDQKSFDNIPTADAYSFSEDPALIYYCANETVDGVEFSAEETSPASFPFQLLPKNALLPLIHAIIYAGAQKNVGPAGLTILIILYNTPPVLSIYITGLVLEYMLQLGGLDYYASLTNRKSKKLYDVLKDGDTKGIFKGKVKEGSGSQMNVVFDVLGEGLLAKFIAGAEERGMKGVRVSIYNAVTEEEADQLISYMEQFAEQHEVNKE
ncbi:pyridoxal phosphate-dependent transferase [Suillus lakei]|nr:pyridoxal phosphate-dependent transferase [Suillus lakei]